ncbi:MAG: hypothetical protein HFH24_02990 [Ruminococcus sp.]|nr:hypothetical protein [Ruminococcus sp.]
MGIFFKKKNAFIKNEKIYVGRESVCMGDDVTAPNMSSFILTDDSGIFMNHISKYLPYIAADRTFTWKGYKGRFETGSDKRRYPDGICVLENKSSAQLFSITVDRNHNILDFQMNDNWYEIMKEWPYLYLKR